MPTDSNTKKRSFFSNVKHRTQAFLARRPHRTFRLTRRRDYIRPLHLSGVFSFTAKVSRTLWQQRRLFVPLAVIYVFLYIVLVGTQSQETYTTLTDTLESTAGDSFEGVGGTVGKAGLLFLSLASSGVSGSLTEAQQIFSVIIFLMTWVTTVWLLRNLLAGHKVKLRDGLYNAGAPIFATILIALLLAVQFLPVAIAIIGYNAAATTGLLAGGVAAMLFWFAAALLVILSLYWATSTLFAMVIITLPGMYPYRAVKTAGDIMVGRRVKILLRWFWMIVCAALFIGVTMLPIILLDMWLASVWSWFASVPFVPFALLVISTISIIWVSAYVYLLYREVVDDSE